MQCLQCVAVCCSRQVTSTSTPQIDVLRHVTNLALRCSDLQCVAECCSMLQCVALCCSTLQCVAVRCSALQCVAVRCSALQCVAVRCSALQFAVTHSTPQLVELQGGAVRERSGLLSGACSDKNGPHVTIRTDQTHGAFRSRICGLVVPISSACV